MNILHDITPGTKKLMTAIIEIPRGSRNKYELDKKTGLIKLDRVLYSAQDYPFDYGFIPQTLWDDGDPLDIIVLTTNPLFPGISVEARPIGLLHMNDSGEPDEKVIAVANGDPRYAHIKDIKHANPHFLKEIQHFFTTYKILQEKTVKLGGIEGRQKAEEAFTRARALYDAKKKKAA